MTPALPAVRRARLLLVGLFALAGLAVASWLARIPAVRDLLDLSTADLGLLLLVGSLGSLVTLPLAGAVLQRLGARRVLLVSTFVLAAALVLMGTGPAAGSRTLLAGGILLNGVAVALGNVALNVESGRVERALGRTVIPQFHAAFSVGAVVGSATGALASAAGVPVATHLATVAAVVVVWRLASLAGVVLPSTDVERAPATTTAAAGAPAASAPRARRLGSALDAWRERRTLLVGVVVLAAAFSEGTANNWLSLAVVDGFGRTESVGGAVLGLFVAVMTVVRLLGTRLLDRFGRVAVLRGSGAASVVGLLVLGFAPTLPLAVAGVALWGAGAALAVPVGIAAASDDPVRAAGRVAVVSAFASVASLVAPPVLGVAAAAVGTRQAIVLVVLVVAASLAASSAVARDDDAAHEDGTARDDAAQEDDAAHDGAVHDDAARDEPARGDAAVAVDASPRAHVAPHAARTVDGGGPEPDTAGSPRHTPRTRPVGRRRARQRGARPGARGGAR